MKIGLAVIVVLLLIALILGSSYDLIPNLVETVKGFAQHEEAVFGEIAKARAAYLNASTPAEKIAANSQLDASLAKVLVLTENYPQLRSNENFLRLQDELAGTENRIAVERRRYNEAVQDYNTYISLFPNSLVASIGGFTRNDAYFKTEPGARQAPKVNFSPGTAPSTPTPTPAPAKP